VFSHNFKIGVRLDRKFANSVNAMQVAECAEGVLIAAVFVFIARIYGHRSRGLPPVACEGQIAEQFESEVDDGRAFDRDWGADVNLD
jgi:hypothetical protein